MKTKEILDPISVNEVVENKQKNDNKNRSKKQVKKATTSKTYADEAGPKGATGTPGIPGREIIVPIQLPVVTTITVTKITWYTKVCNWFKKTSKKIFK